MSLNLGEYPESNYTISPEPNVIEVIRDADDEVVLIWEPDTTNLSGPLAEELTEKQKGHLCRALDVVRQGTAARHPIFEHTFSALMTQRESVSG